MSKYSSEELKVKADICLSAENGDAFHNHMYNATVETLSQILCMPLIEVLTKIKEFRDVQEDST